MQQGISWADCYYDHYERVMGFPRGDQIFGDKKTGKSIQILTYDSLFPNYRAFASIGLTHFRHEVGHHAEVLIVADDGWDAIPHILGSILYFMIEIGIEIKAGLAIGGLHMIAPEFVNHFNKSSLYFSHPQGFSEGFSTVSCGAEQAHLYQAFFISPEEREFYEMYGADALETLFEERAVDPVAIKRPSCIK